MLFTWRVKYSKIPSIILFVFCDTFSVLFVILAYFLSSGYLSIGINFPRQVLYEYSEMQFLSCLGLGTDGESIIMLFQVKNERKQLLVLPLRQKNSFRFSGSSVFLNVKLALWAVWNDRILTGAGLTLYGFILAMLYFSLSSLINIDDGRITECRERKRMHSRFWLSQRVYVQNRSLFYSLYLIEIYRYALSPCDRKIYFWLSHEVIGLSDLIRWRIFYISKGSNSFVTRLAEFERILGRYKLLKVGFSQWIYKEDFCFRIKCTSSWLCFQVVACRRNNHLS